MWDDKHDKHDETSNSATVEFAKKQGDWRRGLINTQYRKSVVQHPQFCCAQQCATLWLLASLSTLSKFTCLWLHMTFPCVSLEQGTQNDSFRTNDRFTAFDGFLCGLQEQSFARCWKRTKACSWLSREVDWTDDAAKATPLASLFSWFS